MTQMNPLDGIFLSMETPDTPAHVGGLAILDPSTHLSPDASTGDTAFNFSHFRDFVAERIALCPRFGWRVREVPFGIDLPYWVDDEALDFNEHVRRAALPAPGTTQELAELAGHLFAMPLDRTRPLWEMYLIEGLQGGRMALLWKVHHCLMDGVSGAGLMELLFDLSPEPAKRPDAPADDDKNVSREVASPTTPAWDKMLARALRNAAKRNVKLAENLWKVASDALGKNDDARADTPRASFNGSVGSRRTVAWTSVPMSHLKSIKDQLGVTLNDVILGLTSGAVRDYLEARDELPELPLKAMVPMSTRKPGDQSVGNQIREMAVDWATDLADPIERILRIHEGTVQAKGNAASGSVNLMQGIAESLPPAAMRLIAMAGAALPDTVQLPANAVVSNVRMPAVPFYIAGAKITATIPISVLAPTQGLNITAISYCDELYFGITADPRLVSDPWALAEGTSKSLIELQAAVEEWSLRVG